MQATGNFIGRSPHGDDDSTVISRDGEVLACQRREVIAVVRQDRHLPFRRERELLSIASANLPHLLRSQGRVSPCPQEFGNDNAYVLIEKGTDE
jgi:hypothetical protein